MARTTPAAQLEALLEKLEDLDAALHDTSQFVDRETGQLHCYNVPRREGDRQISRRLRFRPRGAT